MDFRQKIGISLVAVACSCNALQAAALATHDGDGKKIVSETTSARPRQTITGCVKDMSGEPVIGATVCIEGRQGGTVTDIDGRFAIEASMGDIIDVSYIGFEKKQSKVNATSVNITLQEDNQTLNEVVVVGYGTQKKANLTGAVDQVGGEVFDNRSVPNATQALQGAVPNLNITLTDGKPTRSASYNVRGTTSIGQGGSALVLIDGVEGDPAMLNPDDIATVSVLKDAASAAIYGARGTFGVVLITTKNAQKERASINYSGSFSVEKPVTVPSFVTDGYEYASHFYEAYHAYNDYSVDPKNINKTQEFSLAWLDAFKRRKEQGIAGDTETDASGKYVYYGNTDYYDALYKKSTFAQNHNISVSGGSGKLNYYLSGRYYGYDGLFRYNTDKYDMLNLRAKGAIQVFSWLKISNNTEFSNMKYHNPMNVGEGGSIWRNISDEGHPTAPIFNPDGALTYSAAYTVGDFIYGKNGIDTDNRVLSNTTGLTASFLDDRLHVRADFTFRNTGNAKTQRRVPVPYSKNEGETLLLSQQYNDLSETSARTSYLATNIYADYEQTFAGGHYMKAMAGYNYEQSTYKSISTTRNGLLTPDADNINMALGDAITTAGAYNRWRIAGGFYRLNYSYRNRYLLETNGRYDGSSKFPTHQQWAFFPSVSAGWRISEEPFWRVSRDLVPEFKLRASYGSLGNGNVSPYSYLELMSINTSSRIINGGKHKYVSAPEPIPDGLTWETATTTDFGLDLAMLRNRLSLTADYYIRKTKNMYTVGMTLPEVFGANSPKGNYADMSTYGWEVSIAWKDQVRLAGKPLHYEVKASLADYYSKIDRYNNSTKSLDDYYEGQTVGEIWGYVTEGLFRDQADIDSHASQKLFKSSSKKWYPGDVKFKDLDGNNVIDYGKNTLDDHGDKKVIGNSLPRYIYSVNLSADWNNIFFSAFFQGVGKQDWYPSAECIFWGQYNRPYNNMPKWHEGNYWTEDNPDAYLPRYCGYNNSLKATPQTRYLQNAAYIRLKNLQVGYNLPKTWIRHVAMQSARVYVSAENLWCWSPLYKHTRDLDVTNINGSDRDLTNGTSGDGNSYPQMKSVTLGLSLSF